ncbi:L-lactate permease [Rummeliibacillus suwonensis]|uniref:L-lactate permease n=1 Tax=Rummeliibacillus suwonensis TaxID=1306154 RepID=UPI00289C6D93|nr:L-lactate permease [Rummeliibacillus suwonensis]
MMLLMAIIPILSVFIFLFFLKQTSLRAGVFSLMVVIMITFFYHGYKLTPENMIHSSLKGLFISFIAAYVLFFGILLFHFIDGVGGIQSIASFISQATNDHIIQVLILVAGISPLIESTSGFGIAFMIITPIFVALGFHPVKAVLLGLVSLLAVPWGALATGTVIGAQLGGISLQKLGTGTALISIPIFIYFMVIAVYIAGGFKAIKAKWKELMLFSIIFSISILLFNTYVSVELAGVLGALVTTGIGLMIIKISSLKLNKEDNNKVISQVSASKEKYTKVSMLKTMSPYIILTVLIFISRLWAPFRQFLESHFVVTLPSYDFSMALLYSPGFWLFVTCLLTIFIFKINKDKIFISLVKTFKQWIPFVISTAAFVCISEIMSEAGMISTLANTAGNIFGNSFLLIAPLIGGIGGFLTGSNTGSNAMFMKLQVQTAQQVGLSSDFITFAQNASSSHSTMASPARVTLGAALCGIPSQENRILKSISFIVLGSIALIIIAVLCLSILK